VIENPAPPEPRWAVLPTSKYTGSVASRRDSQDAPTLGGVPLWINLRNEVGEARLARQFGPDFLLRAPREVGDLYSDCTLGNKRLAEVQVEYRGVGRGRMAGWIYLISEHGGSCGLPACYVGPPESPESIEAWRRQIVEHFNAIGDADQARRYSPEF
jgi:hypothetical protein